MVRRRRRLLGLLPVAQLSRTAWIAVGAFAAFIAWTALATTWSISTGRSLQDLSLVACYLGVLVLAVAIHRQQAAAVRHTVGAVSTAIVVVAALALASRFWPHLFANSQQTAQFLTGAQARLSWPLDYWNALAALMALGVPLLLSVATSARTLKAQAAAAAGLPIVALCAALTLSRGGVIASAVALVVFFALAPERFPKVATALVTGAGSAALIAGAFHRSALQQGLANADERHEAGTLLVAVILVCAGVAILQAGIGLAARHGTPPRLLVVPVARARWLLGAGIVVIVAAALAAGAPHHLSHAWSDFKNPASAISPTATSRFGSASGEGRYTYWSVAVHATRGHVLGGSGPGTYQLLWLPRAPFPSYVTNAHSLYFETLSELGIVGLGLLVLFFAIVLAAGVRLVVRSRYEERARAAAIVAALVAFMVFAAFDWIWQVPVLPAAFLLLVAALLAPRAAKRRVTDPEPAVPRSHLSRRAWQAATIVLGAASIVAILFPLATGNAITESQTAASNGNVPAAIADAQQAVRLEPSWQPPSSSSPSRWSWRATIRRRLTQRKWPSRTSRRTGATG